MFSEMLDDYKGFYSQPFSVDMSVTGWFLFIGLVTVIMVVWSIILGLIIRGIEEAS